MKKRPVISFVTPVYNNEKLILNTADSILNQTDDEIEYIIVDDGSTDNTPQVVDDIAKRDSRVKVIHQKNQWIYASFNNGIKEASGEYIYIVNSDDCLRSGSYDKMKEIIDCFHPDVIWTQILIHKCDQNQNILQFDYLNLNASIDKDEYFDSSEKVKKSWAYFGKSLLAQNQANLYKREIMLNHPFRNDVYGADTLFNLDIAREISSCYVMKDAVYDFFEYCTKSNASVGKYYEYEHQMFNEILEKNENLYKEFQISPAEYEYIYARRLSELTHEIRTLSSANCDLKIEDKIERVFLYYLDDVVYSCAQSTDRMEELESRVLSGIRELFLQEVPQETSDVYFIYELLESLLCYEKDADDYKKIRNGVFHPMNRYHIGKCFYEKLLGKETRYGII